MKVRFGIDEKKVLTGAEVYVRIFQVASLLPILYIFAVSGYPAIITGNNVLSFLFKAGMMCIPRAESLALSVAFRVTSSELTVYFGLLVIAFVYGLVAGRLLRSSYRISLNTRIVFASLIAADIIFRLIPIRVNLIFGITSMIIGTVVRLVCLALIILDLHSARGSQ